MKNWLMHKKRKVELAPKRTWKKYWVCLKGTMLLFYSCEEGESIREDSIPRHMLGTYAPHPHTAQHTYLPWGHTGQRTPQILP